MARSPSPRSALSPLELGRQVLRSASRLTQAAGDLARGLGRPEGRAAYGAELRHLPAATSLLPWLARSRLGHTLMHAAADNARRHPSGVAFRMDDEIWTWRDFEQQVSAAAHELAARGVGAGDVVALVGHNAPAYVAMAYAIGRVGAVAALINYQLAGPSLRHALAVSKAVAIVVDDACANADGLAYTDARAEDAKEEEEEESSAPRWTLADFVRSPASATSPTKSHPPSFPLQTQKESDDFLYIYTSGTTGLPKPCRVSHSRALMAGAAAAKLGFRFGGPNGDDLLYCVLPLYHANAFMLGVGACVTSATPIALRDGFSARAFWPDVIRYGATAFNYIGELGRYIADSPHDPAGPHRLRVAFGNGLQESAWRTLQSRFGIASVREFYAATESPGGLINFSERPGSIGHLPLRRLGWLRLARYDADAGTLVRGPDGFLQECDDGEAGELLVRLPKLNLLSAVDFRGYTDEKASNKKVLTDAFETGDRYFRSGDLLRYDRDDYFYFVDRVGDTYRWRGENVSTLEVAAGLSNVPTDGLVVVGVAVPGQEGRAGLVALVPKGDREDCLRALAEAELPLFARPRFVRILPALETTGTYKLKGAPIRQDGADPRRIDDPLYYWNGERYAPLDAITWDAISRGEIRL